MRHRITPKPVPALGETRVRTRFLWWPKELGGEWRWLERASWVQLRVQVTSLTPGGGSNKIAVWADRHWAAPEEG